VALLHEASPDRQVGRYRQLQDASEKALAGQMSGSQFREFLEHISGLLAEKAEAIISTIREHEYDKDYPDEVEMGLDGVRGFESGLQEMWMFSQDSDPRHVHDGLAMIWEGNQKIINAMRLNREMRAALAEEWEKLQGHL
ncbi:MAG: hypothetical protein ACYCW6_27295, partial [Candidatus Xenobia bacterium]